MTTNIQNPSHERKKISITSIREIITNLYHFFLRDRTKREYRSYIIRFFKWENKERETKAPEASTSFLVLFWSNFQYFGFQEGKCLLLLHWNTTADNVPTNLVRHAPACRIKHDNSWICNTLDRTGHVSWSHASSYVAVPSIITAKLSIEIKQSNSAGQSKH
jgi:hypothetical protein